MQCNECTRASIWWIQKVAVGGQYARVVPGEGRGSHTYSNHILHPPPLHTIPPSRETVRGGKGTTPGAEISGGNDPLTPECASRGAK